MKKISVLILCLFFCIGSCIFSYATKISDDLTSNIFRIHIIANSDSIEDQEIKLKIRDNILQHFSSKNPTFSSIDECIQYYNANLEQINQIVLNTLDENNVKMPFTSKICKSYFPTKEYEYFSLPTGTYNCLKIELGEANGQNWWCVLYPNLCITDYGTTKDSQALLQNTLTTDAYDIVTSDISYKFKIVEYLEELKSAIYRQNSK